MGPEMGTLPSEYSQALRSIRAAKTIFWCLLLLAILAQLVVFGLTVWGGVLDALYKADTASKPATSSTRAIEIAEQWRINFQWILPMTQFLAMVMGLLLVMSLQVAVLVALVGRLGGVGSLVSAFFWSLLLAAILVPWHSVFEQSPFTGALFDYNDLYFRTRDVKTAWAPPT